MKILFRQILSILTGLVACASSFGASAPAEEMSLFALNVGKADCLLLRSGKTAYLIDTARGRSFDGVEAILFSLGITRLDAVLITHMDSDHVGGLKKLLKSDIQVDHLYIPAFFLPEKEKDDNPALKAVSKLNLPVDTLRGGDSLPLDGGELRVLGPLRAAEDKEDNNSLVLWARSAAGSVLLAGDMEFPEESDLLSAGVLPRADVLKVANHGVNDATSEALLTAVQPRVAVISTSSEEKSSTPAPRVLRLLASWNVEVFQTQDSVSGVLVTLRDGEITAEIK